MSTNKGEVFTELDWITLKKDIDSALPVEQESALGKFKRKFKENPLVPVGCLTTAGVLSVGMWSMIRGNKKFSQTMMRLRVLAQGATVAAMLVGVAMTAFKGKQKH